MSIISNGLIGGAGGGGETIWLISAVRTGGTFLNQSNTTSISGSATNITGLETDASSLTLLFIVDRGDSFEPVLTVNGVVATRDSGNTLDSTNTGTFTYTVSIPSAATISASTGSGSLTIPVIQEAPAIVSDLVIVNNPASGTFYPVGQTELKAGDPVYVSFSTDKDIRNVQGSGNTGGSITVVAGSTFTDVLLQVAATGITAQELVMQINTTTVAGAVSSNAADSSNTVLCNNLYPTVVITNLGYPATQSALKNSEVCTVSMNTADFDTIVYSTPLNQITIPNLTTDEATKVVTRIAGSYNDSSTNYRCTANRIANNATTVTNGIIFIANVAPTINVTEPATSLRSGGNDNTLSQNHLISVVSDQRLALLPDLLEGVGSMAAMSWSTTAKTFTSFLIINDNDIKGTYAWGGLLATGLSGLTTTTITGDSNVVIAGFVSRTVALPAFGNTVVVNTGTFDLANITVAWSFQPLPLTRRLLDTNDPFPQEFFVSTTGTTTTIHLLNVAATTSSSQASSLTIEETI